MNDDAPGDWSWEYDQPEFYYCKKHKCSADDCEDDSCEEHWGDWPKR